MEIITNFEADLKEILLEFFNEKNLLKKFDIQPDKKHLAELQNKTLQELLHVYINFCDRLLFCKKSNVYMSKELRQSPLYNQYKKEILKLKRLFENGSSIRPFLSDRIKNLIFNKSIDGLLLDWGLHHIHLKPKSKRKNVNDNLLLFIMKQGDNIYFVDIASHGDFFNFKLLKIIHNNWKESLQQYKLVGIKPDDSITEETFKNLRKYNVAYTIKFDDEPDMAYTTQLRSMLNKKKILYLAKFLEVFQKNIQNDKDSLYSEVFKKFDKKCSHAEIKMVLHKNKILFIVSRYNININFNSDIESLNNILKTLYITK